MLFKKWLLNTLEFGIILLLNLQKVREKSRQLELTDNSAHHSLAYPENDPTFSNGSSNISESLSGNMYAIQLKGVYTWELLFDIDNTNNSGMIQRVETITTSYDTSYMSFIEALQEYFGASSLDAGGGFVDVVRMGVKGSVSAEIKRAINSVATQKTSNHTENKKTTEIIVGPHSHLKLYRLVFNSPGVTYATDTLSSTKEHMDDVIISCTVKRKLFIKDIDVIYTKDSTFRPKNVIEEANYGNPNLNPGVTGQYVWLAPIWTTKIDEAATGFEIAYQRKASPYLKDLNAGTSFLRRYLIVMKESNAKERITEVGLLRTMVIVLNPRSHGWQHCTNNINWGRMARYLYLCWNTMEV